MSFAGSHFASGPSLKYWSGVASHSALRARTQKAAPAVPNRNAKHAAIGVEGRHDTQSLFWRRTIYANGVRVCGDEDPNLGCAAGPNLRNTTSHHQGSHQITFFTPVRNQHLRNKQLRNKHQRNKHLRNNIRQTTSDK
jgi:hypothetical protein